MSASVCLSVCVLSVKSNRLYVDPGISPQKVTVALCAPSLSLSLSHTNKHLRDEQYYGQKVILELISCDLQPHLYYQH